MISWRYLGVAAFAICLHVPLTMTGQSIILTADHPIQELYFNTEGRLYTLATGQVCQYEDFQKVGDCITLPGNGDQLIGINDRALVILSGTELFYYVEGALIRRDTFPDLIFSAVHKDDKLFVATATGLYSYAYSKGEKQLIGFSDQYVNAIAIVGDQLVLGLDDALVAVDFNGTEIWRNSDYGLALEVAQTSGGIALISNAQEVVFLDAKGQKIRSWNSPFGKTEQLIVTADHVFVRTASGVYEIKEETENLLLAGRFEHMLLLDQNLLLVQGADVLQIDLSTKVIPLQEATYNVFSDTASSYWFGQNRGISHLQNGVLQQYIQLPLDEQSVFVSAVSVSDRYVFAGTMGEGLLVFDRKGKFIKRVLNQISNNQNNIIQLKLLDGFLWVAYLNGVIRIDLETLQIRDNYDNLLGNNYLYCIEPLDESRFYIGTSNEGVLYYNEGKVTAFLAGESVYCLSSFNEVLYVGTEKSGVYAIEDSKSTFLHAAKQVYALQALPNQLVINDKESAYVLDLNSLKVFPLASEQLAKAQLNGSSENGEYVALAYENGLLELTKSQLSKLSGISISLNRPKQFNETIEESNPVFTYDQNTISFSYHLNTSFQNKNAVFKYRLVGQDSSWRATQQNQVDFYQLAPGKYQFEIDFGYTADYVPSVAQSFTFSILQPFWLRWEFLGAVGVLFLGLLAFLIRTRERHITRNQERDKAQLQFELHQLKQQVDPHFLFNSMSTLASLVEENPDQGVEALEKLSTLYRRILACQEKELIELSEEIDLVKDYFTIQQLRYETGISLAMQVSPQPRSRVIPLSLQFLVENAIKHNVISSATPLSIRITQEGDYLVISNNLNAKKTQSTPSGFGLKNLKARYSYFSNLALKTEVVDQRFVVHLPIILD